jgi:acetyl esterase/lipase
MLLGAWTPTATAGQWGTPSPPPQPTTGPGGSQAFHKAVRSQFLGQGATAYWLFEPADPVPESAPLIIFNHGWSAINPRTYGAWIVHLVRRGDIVIYPVYQDSARTPMTDFMTNAVTAVRDAVAILQQSGHVHPELEHVAVVGHSMGGAMTANFAALASRQNLPVPRAIMCVEPGDYVIDDPKIFMPREDLSQIPASTLALVVVGSDDKFVADTTAKRIFTGIAQIPAANKDFVILNTDRHGIPPLLATHLSPVCIDDSIGLPPAPPTTEETEWRQRLRERFGEHGPAKVGPLNFAMWRLFDALTDAAFYGRNREFALGDTAQQRDMGKWSDGTSVKELTVTQQP